jgi:hypothetical protein
MAVTVVDNRTVWTNANALTGFTPADVLDTTNYAEGTGSAATAYNIATGSIYYSSGTLDLSDTIAYVYTSCNALQNSWTTGAHALYYGDGTNNVAIHSAGGDRDIFKHADGPVAWQCHVLDGAEFGGIISLGSTYYTTINGAPASLNEASISRLGGYYITQSKALGGGDNCWCDIIRYGNDGLTIEGGTTGARGTFLEVVIEDRSQSSGKGHGIIREYAPGSYGVQGPLTCGSTGSGTSYFDDTAVSAIFEDRYVANDKYYFKIQGSTTFNTNVFLNGFSLATARPFVTFDASSNNINALEITNSTFAGLSNACSFASDASAETHIITNNVFTGLGTIKPGRTIFNNNAIIGYEAAINDSSTSAALHIEHDLDNISDLSFTAYSQADASNHAILIKDASEYTFTNITYSGYAAANGTTGGEMVFNDSGGAVTINLSGGDFPTYRNGTSATTTIVNTITLTMTVTDEAGDAVVGAQAYIDEDNITPFIMKTTTNGSGVASVSWGGGAQAGSTWRVRLYGYKPYKALIDIGSVDIAVPITLVVDPQQT